MYIALLLFALPPFCSLAIGIFRYSADCTAAENHRLPTAAPLSCRNFFRRTGTIVKSFYGYSLCFTPIFYLHTTVLIFFIHPLPIFVSDCPFDFVYFISILLCSYPVYVGIKTCLELFQHFWIGSVRRRKIEGIQKIHR